MMIKYLLILGIGHLLGDFYLQNDRIAQGKDEKFAEYYLLGTLVSTLCVIICRMLILA